MPDPENLHFHFHVFSGLEFLVPFYPIKTARVVFLQIKKMDPLNLYPASCLELLGYFL